MSHVTSLPLDENDDDTIGRWFEGGGGKGGREGEGVEDGVRKMARINEGLGGSGGGGGVSSRNLSWQLFFC